MKTAIVILNWNTKDYLERFLPGVLSSAGCSPDGQCDGSDTEVIVADSASTDGSMEMMRKKFPFVRRIVHDRNYGFTGGYNRALADIRNEGFRYYILLNSDIEVHDGWLEPLVSYMDGHPECAACGPKLHSWYDKDSFEYAGAAGGYLDRFGYPFCRGRVMGMVEKDKGQYDGGPADVLWATGACLMVRADAWWEMGGLDDRFFAHMEEIDFCWRMQLAGYAVRVIPESTVWHLGGGTLPQDSPWKLNLNYRNNLLMLENNLAKTCAVSGGGKDFIDTAKRACGKARRIIFQRMVLDGCSALVYLCTGKKDYFDAVRKAHKEYCMMRRRNSPAEIASWLEKDGTGASVKGLYPGWIVPGAIFKKQRIFLSVRKFSEQNK